MEGGTIMQRLLVLSLLASGVMFGSSSACQAAGPVQETQLAGQVTGQLASSTANFHRRYYGCNGYGYGFARPNLYVSARYPAYGYGGSGYRPYSYYGVYNGAYYRPYVYSSSYGYGGYSPYGGVRPYGVGYVPNVSPYGYGYGTTSYGYAATTYGYGASAYRPYYTYPTNYWRYGYYSYPSYSAFAYPSGYPGAYGGRGVVVYGGF